MNITGECKEKLQQWVGGETWHTGDVFDMKRFYLFIDAYIKANGYHISNESMLAETIAREADVETITREDGIDNITPLFRIIKDRVSLMHDILDFLKATNR